MPVSVQRPVPHAHRFSSARISPTSAKRSPGSRRRLRCTAAASPSGKSARRDRIGTLQPERHEYRIDPVIREPAIVHHRRERMSDWIAENTENLGFRGDAHADANPFSRRKLRSGSSGKPSTEK